MSRYNQCKECKHDEHMKNGLMDCHVCVKKDWVIEYFRDTSECDKFIRKEGA